MYVIHYSSGRIEYSDSEPTRSAYEEARESGDPIAYVEKK